MPTFKKIYTHIIRFFFFQGRRPFMLFIFPWSLSWNPLVFLVRIQIRQLHQRISGQKAYWRWALFVGRTLRECVRRKMARAASPLEHVSILRTLLCLWALPLTSPLRKISKENGERSNTAHVITHKKEDADIYSNTY